MLYRGLMALAGLFISIGAWAGGRGGGRGRRALSELKRGREALAEGRPARSITAVADGRLGELSRVFNELVPRLEAKLATLEGDRQLLGAVLGGMAEGVIAVDARRRLLFANEAAGALFGLGPG